VAFVEGRLLTSQSELFENFSNGSDWLDKSPPFKKATCFDHVNRLFMPASNRYIRRAKRLLVYAGLEIDGEKVETNRYYSFNHAGCCVSHTTPTQKLFCFLMSLSGWAPQRVDCLALRWETALIACLHNQNKRGFFGGPAFFQPIRAF